MSGWNGWVYTRKHLRGEGDRGRERRLFNKVYARGTLLRVLAEGFASSFEPDFWGESSESSCFLTWAEPFGVFMAGAGMEMGERERPCALSTKSGRGPQPVWCDEGTGRDRQGHPLRMSKQTQILHH